MSTAPHSSKHQVEAFARRCRDDLGALAEEPLWSLSAAEAGNTLVLLTQVRGQLDELLMRVLRHATTVETGLEATVPSAGGVAATVVVTMELETLLGGLTAASLDTGDRISASEARRLACRAGIIPIVLGGPSVVLDAGRKRRFHSEAQRIAMGVRDGGCTAHGCDAPPAFCHAHHDQPWSHGGGTSVEKGRLLCSRHHTLIHDAAFQHTLDKHGKVRFTRRT